MKMTKATLQSIVIYRPEPTIRLKGAHVHGQRLRVSRGIPITGRVWLYNSHQIKRKGKRSIKEDQEGRKAGVFRANVKKKQIERIVK